MGCFSLRSLLLAAIVISNCITWTSCRHSFTHNLSGHRRRHRRNGAGLALPSDYVLPGGEGSEAGWGQWGPPSECSRPCGGGVMNQTRICSTFGSDGYPNCIGGATKYYSCNTQDCPDSALDFRAEQCASYNNKTFKGRTYDWVPYTNGPRPCELNCMPRGERFYYRHAAKVVDGTRCNDESFDVCVNGECQPVGCDMMLGSHAREDKCRVCRGNGSSCDTIAAIYDRQDLTQGYTDILLIPEGAMNILIEEIDKSNNYLALRSLEDNKYYLNGEYQISFPRTLQIAGVLWHYERSVQGFAAPDKLRTLGPTTEPLYLSLLTQEPNVGIKYEYSIPKGRMPEINAQYTWAQGNFTPCSVTCGTGFRTRNVTCHKRDPFEEVEENLCDAALRPIANETCQLAECQPQWVPSPWSPCSKLCGEGSQSRTVQCQKIISNGYPSIVDNDLCFSRLGDKPAEYQKCNTNGTCPTWFTGPWKPCDKLCGDGKQTRQVVCHRKTDGRVEVLVDESCEDEKPAAEQPCNIHPCDGIDWVVSNWTGCDSCLSNNYTREALCVTKDHQVVKEELCSYHQKPELIKACDKELPPCPSQWYASQWGKCSVECGKGEKTRKVFCGTLVDDQVEVVDDSKCDPETRYNDTAACEVPDELCPAKWFAADWSECTKECDGGLQYRKVMCLNGVNASNACPESSMPDGEQPCNPEPCNIDELLSTSTTVMDDDDLPECEEEEDEVGAELLTTLDGMMSDSPSTPEGSGSSEGEFFLSSSTGSDFSESGSGDDSITTESSSTVSATGSGASEGTGSTEIGGSSTTEPGVTSSSLSTTDSGSSTEGSTSSDIGASSTSTGDETTESGATVTGSTGSGSTETGASDTEATGTGSTGTGSTETGASDTEATGTGSTGTGSTETGATETGATGTGSTDISIATGSEKSSIGGSETTAESGGVTSSSLSTTDSGSTTEGSTSSDTGASSTSTEAGTGSTETETSSTGTEETESTVTETTETATTETATTDTASTETGTEDTASTETETSTETASTGTGSDGSTTGATSGSETTTTGDGVSSSSLSTSDGTVASESTTETGTGSTATGSEGSTSEGSSATEKSPGLKDSTKAGETPPTRPPGVSTSEDTSSSTTVSDGGSSISPGSSVSVDVSGSTSEGTTSASSGSSSVGDVSGSTSEGVTSSSLSTSEGSTSSDTGASTTTTEAGTGSTETGSTETGSTETGSTGTGSEGSTTTDATGGTGSTTEAEGTGSTSEETTPWDLSSLLTTSKPRCRPRNKPAKCTKSKFGCCPDKRTAAGGPFDEGCPSPTTCKDTKYGCCPDGVSPAGGEHNENCPVPNCTETLYGCCKSDNKTAAEGNDQEGCPPPCKVSKYGCCADNETQATGPHKAGCPESATTTTESTESTTDSESTTDTGSTEMESTETTTEGTIDTTTARVCSVINGTEVCQPCSEWEHGCCKDGKTPAHGANDLGCCLLSPHGCCPDNYQAASGPDLEGCECKSSPFGCCPDNKSYARGPNFTGCGCEYTPHGCCPDRHTEATGPNFEGCSCHTYQFGCCPDGESIAEGPRHQGCLCRDTPFGCCSDGVTPAAGPNHEGCDCASSKFGCCLDGVTTAQSNNFTGCAEVPVNRQAACALTYDAGPCTNYSMQWYYDMTYGGCSRFHYGGCGGNGNRFANKDECEDVCVQPADKDVCKLPKVKGSCGHSELKWYYDSQLRVCAQFYYGSCLGNGNRFDTRELCEKKCAPAVNEDDKCLQTIEKGPCAGNYTRWGYDDASGECKEFTWGGCEGNSNRFISKAACTLQCNPPGVKRPECQLAQDAGNCSEMIPYWSFDGTEERCVPIYYSGCGGNDNKFSSLESCEAACPKSFEQDKCTLPAESGECRVYRERWFYDTKNQQCRMFPYGGCGGNANNFLSEEHCKAECARRAPPPPAAPAENTDICSLPPNVGPCRAALPRWYFNAAAGRCFNFIYGGCDANGNNFQSERECEQRCAPPAPPVAPVGPECRVTDLTACVGVGRVWYVEPTSGRCTEHDPAPTRPGEESCNVPGVFPSPEACERACGDFKDLGDVCRFDMDAGSCHERQLKYYYDARTQSCQPFYYSGCYGSANRFSSATECESICIPDLCKIPQAPGNCTERIRSWSYDESTDECTPFEYTGCNGNANRFNSKEECEGQCKQGAIELPTEPPTIEEQCQVPSSLEPCGEEQMAFYYDDQQRQCVSAPIGGCTSIPNRYRTEEECLRSCGDFKEQDICHAPLDPGPCRDPRQKYYWNLREGRCEPFTYGGCAGGPNRFTNEQECQEVCGHLAIDPACGLPPAPGAACAGAAGAGGPRWHRSALYGDCRPFVYLGCGGNRNNFRTKQECERHCSPPPPGNAPGENEVACERERSQCAELRCQFGITWTKDPSGGCDRCSCDPHPCADMQCRPGQRCHVAPYRAANGEVKYTSQCRSDCSAEQASCSSLECEYTVQRTRTPDGCERCACVRPEPNCQPFVDECAALKCNYGPITRTVDGDGCERCTCIAHPCEGKRCPEGQRCVVTASRDATSGEPQYSGDCGTVNKPGSCPAEAVAPGSCHVECNDDADCRGIQKCCHSGCSQLCRAPAPERQETGPLVPQAPQPDPATEREVSSSEGGTATLRCLFHSNPPPQITWQKGEITIDGSQGRYKLTADGALQIVSLYRDDSGVYICVAQNELGSSRQEVVLKVDGPVSMPAGIIDESPSEVAGEISQPIRIRCLAYGYPQPHIRWFHGTDMVPYDSAEYEARENMLLIRSLRTDTLGEYTCQVYNGVGRAVSRSVVVRAQRPASGAEPDSPYWLQRAPPPPAPRTERPRTHEQQTAAVYPLIPREYTVNVHTSIHATQTALATGGRLDLSCDVDGHPEPRVYWTKDNQRLAESDRIYSTPSRLSITQVAEEDAGEYGCNADNGYTSHRSTVQITVQKLYIPEQCKDNQYFATCTLIVRSKLCRHEYYSKFCCKTCVEAGELNPLELEFQADQSWTFKKK